MGLGFSSRLTRETLTHAISGAVGSAASVSVFYPLETVRTRKQVDKESPGRGKASHSQPILVGLVKSLAAIHSKEGLKGLYKGYSAVVTSLFCSNFVYFYAYVYLKALFETFHQKDASHSDVVARRNSLVDLFTAFLAGCVNVFVTTPLWVANTRLKLQGVDDDGVGVGGKKGDVVAEKVNTSSSLHSPSLSNKYDGLLGAVLTIGREEGLPALYSGTLPSLLLVLNPALQWTIYEFLKLYCQKWGGSRDLSAATYFVISALAKFCSTTVTYPLQVVQTRMRFRRSDGAVPSSSRSSATLRMLMTMLNDEGGLRGLFKGLESKIVQTVLTSAFMFVVYEKTVAFLGKILLPAESAGGLKAS